MPDPVIVSEEKTVRKSGGTRVVLVCKCSASDCQELIRVRRSELITSKLLCKVHVHRKRPFEGVYNSIKRDWRKTPVELTYEEYLEFTKISRCYYCDAVIPWEPYGTVHGEFRSLAYYLDRKDLAGPYSAMNCVVCCTACNILRGNRFTYEEFMLLAPALSKIRAARDGA